jgi:hypothetical protein
LSRQRKFVSRLSRIGAHHLLAAQQRMKDVSGANQIIHKKPAVHDFKTCWMAAKETQTISLEFSFIVNEDA